MNFLGLGVEIKGRGFHGNELVLKEVSFNACRVSVSFR